MTYGHPQETSHAFEQIAHHPAILTSLRDAAMMPIFPERHGLQPTKAMTSTLLATASTVVTWAPERNALSGDAARALAFAGQEGTAAEPVVLPIAEAWCQDFPRIPHDQGRDPEKTTTETMRF